VRTSNVGILLFDVAWRTEQETVILVHQSRSLACQDHSQLNTTIHNGTHRTSGVSQRHGLHPERGT